MPSLEALQKLLDADPADAFVLYAIAQEHAKGGAFEDAVAFYDRAIGVTPDDPYCYYHKATALLSLERAGDALETIRLGLDAASRTGDAKATGELSALRDSIDA